MNEDKVTFIGLLSTPSRLVLGSYSGYLTFHNLAKIEETVSFQMHANNMTRII